MVLRHVHADQVRVLAMDDVMFKPEGLESLARANSGALPASSSFEIGPDGDAIQVSAMAVGNEAISQPFSVDSGLPGFDARTTHLNVSKVGVFCCRCSLFFLFS